MDFYVYAHLNPFTLNPFYIGKGKSERYKQKSYRSRYWLNYSDKYGFMPIKLVDGLTDNQACEIEKQYIEKYGFIKSGGLLVNHTKGGSGGNTFDPIGGKNWNSGKTGVYNESAIKKMRDARIGKKLEGKTKEKVLAGLRKASQVKIGNSYKVKCLITNQVWDNRKHCMDALAMNLKVFQQRIFKNKPIKGNHLQYIKNN